MTRRALALVLLLAACPGPRPPAGGGGGDRPPPAVDAGPPPEPPPWQASGIDWSKPPAPGPATAVQLPTPTRFRLGNGIDVQVVARPRLPIISASLVVPRAGSQEDPPALAGLAALTGDLLDEGAGDRDAVGLAAELERLGADLGVSLRPDAAVVSLDCLSDTLVPGLELLAAVVGHPRLTAEDFARIKNERVAALHRRRDRPANVAALVLERVLFGGHPYGHPTSGYEASVAAISHDDAVQFWKQHWTPAGATLVVVGDVDPEALRGQLEASLGRWRGGKPGKLPALRLPTAAPPRLVVVDKPGASQSAVLVGRVLWRRDDPRIHAIQIANTVLGGSFTSRLNQRLREELGWTYGASSYFWFGRAAATWTAEASIDTPHTAEGLREMLAQIAAMRTAPPDGEELDRARTLLARELPEQLESNSSVVDLLGGLVVEGIGGDWYATRQTMLAGTDAAAVEAAAEAAWTPDQLVVVVVGDLARVRDGLLALGLGQAIEVDPEGLMRGPFEPR